MPTDTEISDKFKIHVRPGPPEHADKPHELIYMAHTDFVVIRPETTYALQNKMLAYNHAGKRCTCVHACTHACMDACVHDA